MFSFLVYQIRYILSAQYLFREASIIYLHMHIRIFLYVFYIFCFHTLIFLLLYALLIETFFSPRKHDSQSSNPYLVLLSPQLHSIVIHLESFDHLIMCLFPHLSLQLYALISYYYPKSCSYFHQNVSLRTQASSVPN